MDAVHQRIMSRDNAHGQNIISPNFLAEAAVATTSPNPWEAGNQTADASFPEGLNKTGLSIENFPQSAIQVKHKAKSFGILPGRA